MSDLILEQNETNFKQRLTISMLIFGGLALLLNTYVLGASYFSVSGYSDWGMVGQELALWITLGGIALMMVSLVGLLIHKIRPAAVAALLGAGAFVTITLCCLWWADQVRNDGFSRLAKETVPLVTAIEAYQKEHGVPPEDLDAIQVDFPAGHTVKGGGLPEFEYVSGYLAQERYHGNPWVLVLDTPTGPLRWDQFVYYPLQNYPSLGNGGWFEQIEGWAYIHE